MKVFKVFFFFCLFGFIFIFVNFFSEFAFANEDYFFNEEFDANLSDSAWTIYKNAGNFELLDSHIHLYSNGNSFPLIHTNNIIFPQTGDFELTISFQYLSNGAWGDGIVVSDGIPPNFSPATMGGYTVFSIWQDTPEALRIATLLCPENNPGCDNQINNIFHTKTNDFDTHLFRLLFKSNKYEIFLDNQKIFTSTETTKRPKFVWLGHYVYTDPPPNHWTDFQVDYIRIRDDISLYPTLLLPGLGGCFSREAILLGKESDNWNLGPGVFIYDNLRDTLTSNDYTEGDNFDVFCYDWRKEIDKPNLPDNEVEGKYLVSDFKQKIDDFYTRNNHQKINLIGHSMGGLIIRAYAQRYGMDKINKIVTAGSPFSGTIKAYEVWEGAQIIDPERFNLADFFMQMLLTANRLKYSTVIETIRNIAPSGENFLPTFVYMKSKRNPKLTLLPQNLIQKNNFLFALNDQNFDDVKLAMTTIAGIEEDEDYNTLRWLIINDDNWFGTKNWIDVLTGKWEDMKPDYREFSPDGDLHILKLSSLIDGTKQVEVRGTHDSIMHEEEGLQAILNGLNLSYVPVINPPPFLFRVPFIAAIIHSPADIKIVGPDNLEAGFDSGGCSNCYYSAEDGVVFISNAPEGDYQIELTPKDSGGNYRLDFGQITKDKESWNSIEGKISSEPIVYPIKFDPQNIQTVPFASENGEELLEIAKNELLRLDDEFDAISNNSVKRKMKRYNSKSLSYLESAIKYLSKGKFKKSSTYIIRSLSQIYRTRLLINKYYLQNKIDYTTRSLIANKLMNTTEILNHSYVIVRQKSSGINSKTAQRHLNSSKRLLQNLESKFASYNQTNYLLGSIIEKAKEFLSIAEEKFNEGDFESSYIHSFGARWLILEAMRLGWSGWF